MPDSELSGTMKLCAGKPICAIRHFNSIGVPTISTRMTVLSRRQLLAFAKKCERPAALPSGQG
jgi:hypothetical protein